MEELKIFLKNIIEMDGVNGLIVSGLFVALFFIYRMSYAANCTCLETILFGKKEEKEFWLSRMILFAVLFTIINFIAPLVIFTIAFLFIIAVVLSVVLYIYLYKQEKAKKIEINELYLYYKSKISELMLVVIMLYMPVVALILKLTYESLALGYCAAIASLIEVFIINLSVPTFYRSKSTVYFMYGGQKYYIYKKQEDGFVQCGDTQDISEAQKYKLFEYQEICKMDLFHEKIQPISKEQIKKAKHEYNEKRKMIKKDKKKSRKYFFKKSADF